MKILLKKLSVFFLCETSACGLFLFTYPIGIFDLYVPCSALRVFMDGQEIIPFIGVMSMLYSFCCRTSNLAIGGGRCVSVDILISLMVGIVASLIAAFIYDRIR